MASFSHYLKENLKKNAGELKALTKRDLFRKSEFNTLPRLAAYVGVAAGLVGYLFVPFPVIAAFAAATMATGFAIGSAKQPKQRLEYTAIGSVTPFALPGAVTGGIVLGLQLGVMFAVKAAFNIRDALKSAAKDKAKEKSAAKTKITAAPVAAPVAEPAPAPQPAPAAPTFNAAANENKPAEQPVAPAAAAPQPKPPAAPAA